MPQRTTLARRIGVVFGQRSQLWWDLPLAESFSLLRHVYRVPAGDHAARLNRCRALLDLDEFLDTPVRQLSLGQRMRGELTAALLHGPKVLFLDEPTIGLDVLSKQAVRSFLAELDARGDTTIVLTTHDLADIEKLCRRLVVIDHGRVVHDGTVDDLHAAYRSKRRIVADLDAPWPGGGAAGRVGGARGGRRAAGDARRSTGRPRARSWPGSRDRCRCGTCRCWNRRSRTWWRSCTGLLPESAPPRSGRPG